jgi:hypothetical protein
MIIIGGDPGVVNFGIVVIDSNQHKVLWVGFHSATISHLGNNLLKRKGLVHPNFLMQSKNYLRVCQLFMRAYQPQQLVFERYQARSVRGLNIELINIMVGLWAGFAASLNVPTRVLTAAAWKNTLSALNVDLEQIYQEQALLHVPSHWVDALMLASFVASTGENSAWIKSLRYYLDQLHTFVL